MHKHLNFTTANLNVYCCGYNTEICAVKFPSILSHICVFSICRARTGNFTHFLRKVDIVLKFLYSPKIEYIICGDININCLTDTFRKNQTHC